MKATLLVVLFSAAICSLHAQITIGAGDFANAGDTARVSNAVIPTGLNYKATGADTTWDYSFLQWNTQQVDQMLNPLNTNPVYAIYYGNVGFNSNRSNLASTGSLNISLSNLLTIGSEYDFFYKSNSLYEQQGLGISIDGIPTSVAFSQKDVLYNFPLNFRDTAVSKSSYKISVPGLGAYVEQQTRTNQVDGWGTLTTPFGTFPVLRVFTQIAASDSFYIDTVHFGFNIPVPTQRQYKWIGTGQKEPLLQVNTQVVLNVETINSIVYRDSVRNRPVVAGIDEPNAGNVSFNVYPNPASAQINVVRKDNGNEAQLTVADLNGREVLFKTLHAASETIDISQLSKGIYLVMITDAKQSSIRKIVVQ